VDDPTTWLDWAEEIPRPPLHGPGGGREAWRGYARRLETANAGLVDLVERLVEVNAGRKAEVARLAAEVELLRRPAAARKPKGGRPAVPDETVRRIEYELATGGKARSIARRYHVSHTTVNRIAGRMRDRERLAGAGAPAA
jgi:hypothetical protein